MLARSNRTGFALTDLIAICSIIALVGTVLMPSLQDVDRLPEARSAHGRMAQFLMGDGTVREIKQDVDPMIYGFLFTIQGKEIIDEDDF
jgi:hypothetical protein